VAFSRTRLCQSDFALGLTLRGRVICCHTYKVVLRGAEFQRRPPDTRRQPGEFHSAVRVRPSFQIKPSRSRETISDVDLDCRCISRFGFRVKDGQVKRAWSGVAVHLRHLFRCRTRRSGLRLNRAKTSDACDETTQKPKHSIHIIKIAQVERPSRWWALQDSNLRRLEGVSEAGAFCRNPEHSEGPQAGGPSRIRTWDQRIMSPLL
jgi:hypothetical protein